MVSETKYLFYNKDNPDCEEAVKYLVEKGIAFTKVPSTELADPQLVIGQWTYHGLNRIKLGIEKILEGKN